MIIFSGEVFRFVNVPPKVSSISQDLLLFDLLEPLEIC